MKKVLCCLLFVCLFSLSAFAAALDPSPAREAPQVYTYHTAEGRAEIENPENGYLDGTRLWQGIPGIERVESNGRLWATWFSGGTWETYENYIILVTSEDNGDTWSDARVIIDPDKKGPVRAFDPVLWEDPNGKMWILWNQQFATAGGWAGQDGKCGVWGMYTEDASVEDPIWSEPVRLSDNVCMHKPAVTSYGWILPAYCVNRSITEETSEGQIGAAFYRFVDYGEPWEYVGHIEGDKLPDLDAFIEHGVVELANGDLLAVIRSTNGMLYSISTDGGKTWPKAEQMTNNGEVMSLTISRNHIKRLSSGALLLIYHDDNVNGHRKNLTAALSYDEGVTWSYKFIIDKRNSVSYPDARETADGRIYITYDYSRANAHQILLSVITEDDIKAGKLVSEGSFFRKLINNNSTFYKISGYENPLENLAHVSPTGTSGEIERVHVNATVFSDREYTLFKAPTLFYGHSFVRSSIAKTSVTVTKAGDLYVLTPKTGDSCSQQATLEAQGFELVMIRPLPQVLFSNQSEDLVLMKKACTAGEKFTFQKYTIVITDVYESGDVNDDGVVSVLDILKTAQAIFNKREVFNSDMSGDGKTTFADVVRMMKECAK